MLKSILWKLFKFAAVGAIGTAVTGSVLYTLTEYFKLFYMLSYFTGVLCGVLVNFSGNVLNGNIRLER